jgi:hypothetical protein
MDIQVVNQKTFKNQAPPDAIIYYVGRPSMFGNTTPISRMNPRERVVEEYAAWLDDEITTDSPVRHEFFRLVDIAKTDPLILVCWCAPQACHADILKNRIEREIIAEEAWKKSHAPSL